MLRAGFAEIDITPPLGAAKIGWIIKLRGEQVLDPLAARAAVFEDDDGGVAFVQLDTLCVRWTQADDIRRRVENEYGFAGERIMVSATHNHAGPAVARAGEVERDDAYIETLMRKCVSLFGKALERRQEAALGFNHVFEFEVAHNRRVVMRDGTAKTHGRFSDPDALYVEGPIDPEVAVLAARAPGGELLGAIVNFTCHPTHHGGENVFSAGFPGVASSLMKERGCPVTLYLNGAQGNIHTSSPATGLDMPMEEAGRRLADDAEKAIAGMTFRSRVALKGRSRTLQLPYRKVTEDEIAGAVRGAQRFVDPSAYDRIIPHVLRRIQERRTQPAEVQVLSVGEVAFVGIPAELFVEHGLRIKTESHPRHAVVVGLANGMVGYVPTREAFERGGYETTFTGSSRMAPETGDLLADAAIDLTRAEMEE